MERRHDAQKRHHMLHYIRGSTRTTLRHPSAAQDLHRHIGKLQSTVSRSCFDPVASAVGEKMAQAMPHS